MPTLDLDPAAREVIRLLDGVTDDRLAQPTPSVATVGALLDHLMGLSLAFTWGARKSDEGAGIQPGASSAEQLDPAWRTELPQRLGQLTEAWRDDAAWEGMTTVGGATMPGGEMGVVALDELVLHGWDLARATGQPFHCDDASAAAVLEFTRATAQPEHAASREGLFGPAVDVPEDAPTLDRALGFAGRDPAWTPPPA